MSAIESVNTTDLDKIYTFEVTSSQNLETLAKVLETWESLSQSMQKQAQTEEWADVLSDFRFTCTVLRFDILVRLSLVRAITKYVSHFFRTDFSGKIGALFASASAMSALLVPSRYVVAVNHQGELLAVASVDVGKKTINGGFLTTNPLHDKLCPHLDKKVRGAASAVLIHAAKTYPEKEIDFVDLETATSYYKKLGCTEISPGSFKVVAGQLLHFIPPAYQQKAVQLKSERTITQSA